MVDMNPQRGVSLEENIVATMAPAQTFHLEPVNEGGFQPVKEVVVGASIFR
jgi:hypothetical protein